MSDIVERLRLLGGPREAWEAADEINRLRAALAAAERERDALREKLDIAMQTLRWCALGKSPLARDYATTCERTVFMLTGDAALQERQP